MYEIPESKESFSHRFDSMYSLFEYEITRKGEDRYSHMLKAAEYADEISGMIIQRIFNLGEETSGLEEFLSAKGTPLKIRLNFWLDMMEKRKEVSSLNRVLKGFQNIQWKFDLTNAPSEF